MISVLLTSVSRKVALVRAFQRALRAISPSGVVIGADVNPMAAALYAADARCVVPRGDSPEFIPYLLRLCQERSVRVIVPTRDEELPVFAASREMFDVNGVVVMVAPPDVIARCQDKRAFADFCQQRGFAVPAFVSSESTCDTGREFFFRPRFGKGSGGARRIKSEADLREALTQHPDGLLQECVDAPEYTVDLFADFSGRILSSVARRRIVVSGGESIVSCTEEQPELLHHCGQLARQIGLIGHNTIQAFLVQGTPTFIEINPRYGGGASLSIAAGANTPEYLLRLVLGQAVGPVPPYRRGLAMLRYSDDIFIDGGVLTT